ncbi:amino acid permease [Corynebacterium variabile]|uniref:Gamma-aminobutyrate permease and related permeases n=3 Tax=Corynebacterium variabile TaxID=1727 RepID=A0A0X2NK96_9CORY|nr:amino acid permease [Corynebacterium variabile]AEK37794.1 putative membrane protein [Corynebacterium variabile DSM 44702]CUU65179.1 Gamma-aminobutyrate permease and related permeases [Corynebacterium variabile]
MYSVPPVSTATSPSEQLGTGLKPRHVTMLSLAGAIGAGLFVGSATAINLAGPAVILAYLGAAALVVLVMRMLGEMATANPDSGSFSTYADRAIGHWAGFSIGWLYWWFWVLVIPVEATAAAAILHSWFTAVPLWVFALLVTVALTATNLFSVKNYGEFEYRFALLKVGAIIAFIALGALAFVGVFGGDHAGPTNMWSHGGFAPNGWGAVPAALLTTMFSFMGTEIVTIAASESSNPAGQIRKATNSVILRLGLFYIVSIFLIVCLVPWNTTTLTDDGSFLAALNVLDVPGAKFLVDLVVLVAVASCMNSSLYTASRMMFSLAQRGDAPKAFAQVSGNGVPVKAVLLSTIIGFLAVIGNYVMPDRLFTTLLATSGAVALLVYLCIAISQLITRRKLGDAAVSKPGLVKMWVFPYLTWAVIVAIPAVLIYMAIWSDMKTELWSTAVLTAVVIAAGVYVGRRHPSATPTEEDAVVSAAEDLLPEIPDTVDVKER